MKSVAAPILAVLGLCGLPGASRAQWSSGHVDYVPHTETHNHYVPHGNHYHVVPHSTTHFDPVWHETSGNGIYYHDNGVTYPSATVTYPSPPVSYPSATVNYAPSSSANIVTNSIPPANSVPAAGGVSAARNGTITLTNPAETGGTVNYKVNSFSYAAKPGESQTLNNDRAWTITFDSGRGKRANYRLERGTYRFQVDDAEGWTLARIDDGDAPAPPQ